MNLTEDQSAVVALASGRHLVLAPPGSGKTEMLSQRVFRALEAGVDPSQMLCATFTNRAAFEMRTRVEAERGERILPEIGSIHHFCGNFLRSVGRLAPTVHVMDEVEQRAFIREVVDVFRHELLSETPADLRHTHGVSVLAGIPGVVRDGVVHLPRIAALRERVEDLFADYSDADKSPYADILSAVLISHQRKIGMPRQFLRKMPPSLSDLDGEGAVRAMANAYSGLKRKFRSADFDDLVNETYLYLEKNPLADSRRLKWVQVDEVQDLNPIQWRIVQRLTADDAVSVYFGDVEQAIFSFLGANAAHFEEAVRGCERHYFKTNFRTTPLLLEILMRFSLDALRSSWAFLPTPSDLSREDGVVRAFLDDGGVFKWVKELLDGGVADNVALLVRRNATADELEAAVRARGWRYAKVSGYDLFAFAPMRDFMAFLSLFLPSVPRTAWAALFRRFSDGVRTDTAARYLVRGMFASGYVPEGNPPCGNVPLVPRIGNRAGQWAWKHRRQLSSFHTAIDRPWRIVSRHMKRVWPFRAAFEAFAEVSLAKVQRYSLRELWPERGGPRNDDNADSYLAALCHARERIEKFLRYADHVYAKDTRPFGQILSEDWEKLRTLKEADLLVGDEQVVISTVHKAKGRQFDAVVLPDVTDLLKHPGGTEDESLRLLYVAMSRAKRHLLLFGCSRASCLDGLWPCFAENYVGYYRRRAAGEDLSRDWLSQWEALAALNQACDCPATFEMPASESCDIFASRPLVRMALKVLRHDSDRLRRRNRFLALLPHPHMGTVPLSMGTVPPFLPQSAHRKGTVPASIGTDPTSIGDCRKGTVPLSVGQNGAGTVPEDCLDTLVDCLRQGSHFDVESVMALRTLALRTKSHRVRSAIFHYCRTASVANSVSNCPGAQILETIGDFLYAPESDMRVEAAAVLFDHGDTRWLNAVAGMRADFEHLAVIPDTSHETSIRQLIATWDSGRINPYPSLLRELLFRRATRSS